MTPPPPNDHGTLVRPVRQRGGERAAVRSGGCSFARRAGAVP